ncbi:hypothetical protein [Endothiovibrio diazotrophicus]
MTTHLKPPSESALIESLQRLIRQGIAIHYEVGGRLCELKECTEHGRFMQILKTDLWGMSYQSANKHMIFFRKCNEFPQLRPFAEHNYTKALTLFNGLGDEELAQVEQGTHAITIERANALSVSQLKKAIKRTTHPEPAPPSAGPDYTSRNLQIGFAIQEAFLIHPTTALGATELAEPLGLPADQVFRALWNLEKAGWLEPAGKARYRLRAERFADAVRPKSLFSKITDIVAMLRNH